MRLLRLAALFGSLVMLTATLVLVVERRGDVRDDQEARARGAADAALVSLESTIANANGQVGVSIESLPPTPSTDELDTGATRIAAVTPAAEACVVVAERSACTADDLLATSTAGALLAETTAIDGEVVAGVDEATGSVVVLRRALPPGATDGTDPITAIVSVPSSDLISPFTEAVAASNGAEYVVRLTAESSVDERDEPGVVEGLLLVRDRIGSPFTIGSVDIVSGVDADVGLFGNSSGALGVLIALGSILLVLAAATFLADRRNLEEQAATDDLTGLTNRREFERLAAEAVELADRFGTGLTVMVVDLNGFKQINDTLGHQYGDLVLKGVSDRLVDAVRDTDVVARWGGDEFVILLPGLDDTTAIRSSAERITGRLGGSPVVGDTLMRASLGAAAFPRHGGDLETLLRTADAAMYAAKTGGVDFRVADAELARRANSAAGEDAASFSDDLVVTTDYVGPDRRTDAAIVEPLPPESRDARPPVPTDPGSIEPIGQHAADVAEPLPGAETPDPMLSDGDTGDSGDTGDAADTGDAGDTTEAGDAADTDDTPELGLARGEERGGTA